MKKKLTLITWLLLFCCSGRAQILETYIGTPDRSEIALDVKGLPDGGSVIVGYSTLLGGGKYDYQQSDMLIMRVDAAGNVVWNRRMGVDNKLSDKLVRVIIAKNGDIITVGHMGLEPYFYGGTAVGKATIMRIDPNTGNIIWIQRIMSPTGNKDPKGDVYEDVVELDNGNICAVGVRDWQPKYADGMITLFDPGGNVLWHRVVTQEGTSGFYAVTQQNDKIYTAGHFEGNSLNDLYVAEFDPSGSINWFKQYDYSIYHPVARQDIRCNWAKEIHIMGDYLKVATTVSDDSPMGFEMSGILTLNSANGSVMGSSIFNEPGQSHSNLGAVEYLNPNDAIFTTNPAAQAINPVYPNPNGTVINLSDPLLAGVDPMLATVSATWRPLSAGEQYLSGEDIAGGEVYYAGLALNNPKQFGQHDILYLKTPLGIPDASKMTCPSQKPRMSGQQVDVEERDYEPRLEEEVAITDIPFESTEDPLKTEPACDPCQPFTYLQSNLVAYYNFAGGSTADMSFNGHNGVTVGGAVPTTDVAGNPNCAYEFHGLPGEYIQVPSSAAFNFAAAPFTISAWYRPAETLHGKYELLVGRGTGLHCPDMSGDYSLGLYDCRKPVAGINQTALWDIHAQLMGGDCTVQTNYYHAAGWQHVVAVFDVGPSGTIIPVRIYWNGFMSSNPVGVCGPPTVNAGNIYIGTDFKGKIDDVRIYNVAFSTSDVGLLYGYGIMGCCPPPAPGPQGKPGAEEESPIGAVGELKAFPNPFNDQVDVTIPDRFKGGSLALYNYLGQKVWSREITQGRETLDTKGLANGLYIIECVSGKESSRQKLIKR